MIGESYGLHLTLRLAEVEDRAALGSASSVLHFLRELVSRVGMVVLGGPIVGIEPGEPERSGVSGVVILRESHAAIHTYPELGEALVDLFSCRHFSVEVVLDVLTEFFGSHRVKERALQTRGYHWAAGIAEEMWAWNQLR
jgi:S-adenosylmethionine decarboxylase